MTHTKRGTPIAPTWTQDWIDRVNRREAKIKQNICGARTKAGTPCPLQPNHKNGRCQFHGGFDLTGVEEGNRRASLDACALGKAAEVATV